MADLKISQLTSATLPLAGTEVLPIVQSSSTKKVATDDLTVKNVRSNATTGILQVAGPGASTTRVMTTPDANFTAARTDAAQSFTGDQTLSTGNLVIGTSGKGIDFSATPGTGTSELLADYEEGTWTPEIKFDTTNTGMTGSFSGTYVRVGKLVTVNARIELTAKGSSTGTAYITNLPFAFANTLVSFNSGATFNSFANFTLVVGWLACRGNPNDTVLQLVNGSGTTSTTDMSQGNFTDTSSLGVTVTYICA